MTYILMLTYINWYSDKNINQDINYTTTFNCTAEVLSFRHGFFLLICNDSNSLKSCKEVSRPMIVKSSNEMLDEHPSACALIAEGSGLVSHMPVRKDLPMCCSTLQCSDRLVDPMYDASHDAQLKEYTTDEMVPLSVPSFRHVVLPPTICQNS